MQLSKSASRLSYRSVEFLSNLPFSDLNRLRNPVTHFVLPDLPNVVTDNTKKDFVDLVEEPSRRIVTIAASLYDNPASIVEAAEERRDKYGTKTLLIVGGNSQDDGTITTSEAASIIRNTFEDDSFRIFCAWDPNTRADVAELEKKIHAGATGIITQPILTSEGWKQLDDLSSSGIIKAGIDLIPGVALPKTTKQLIFWSSLFKEPPKPNDECFRCALERFSDPEFDENDRQFWAMEQRDRLLSYECISGLHFMPMGNKIDLMHLLIQ